MKTITCRDHGGTFNVPIARGRPPVRCSPENKCSKAVVVTETVPNSRITRTRTKTTHIEPDIKRERDRQAIEAAKRRVVSRETNSVGNTEPISKAASNGRVLNPSTALAKAAKAQLEPLGWVCTGRASGTLAWLGAVRGEEVLTLAWENGVLTAQNYIMWALERAPIANGVPAHKLPFDPDEMSDGELVRAFSGMKVTWWNRLGQSEVTATIPDKLSIEHIYNGVGDEMPGDRIVKFIDRDNGGYRAFHVGALLKIGR